MCGVFLCLCLQIKPFPLIWTVRLGVVFVQCCKDVLQTTPPPPPRVSCLANFVSLRCAFLTSFWTVVVYLLL